MDQTLWTHTTPKVISKSKNPGGFDPKAYFHSQGIERYVQISSKEIYCWSKYPLSFKARAQKINARLAQFWQKAPISNVSRALALAIILGQTEDITPELKTQFAHAGALHVLALSGMHVAMVVVLLKWLLTPLKSLAYGTKIQAFTLIFCSGSMPQSADLALQSPGPYVCLVYGNVLLYWVDP